MSSTNTLPIFVRTGDPTECGTCGETFHFDLAREYHHLRNHASR